MSYLGGYLGDSDSDDEDEDEDGPAPIEIPADLEDEDEELDHVALALTRLPQQYKPEETGVEDEE